jgi:hypothetical protein
VTRSKQHLAQAAYHDLSVPPRLQSPCQLANDCILNAEVIDLFVRLGLQLGHRSI